MATAGLDSVTVEVEFVAGTWTDVSSSVRWSERVRGRFGRASEFDQVSAATLDLALRNENGAFTPDNPLSPYWPGITENKRIRVTASRGGTPYRLFTGYVASWLPTFPSGDSTSRAVVEVSAVDALGQFDRHELQAEYLEQALALARLASTWVDVFAFNDPEQASGLRNAGATGATSTALGSASLIPTVAPRRGSATVQTGSDSGLALPGYMTFTPSGTAGPLLRVQPQGFGVQRLDMWLRFPVTTLPAPGIPLRVMDAWQSQTTRVCHLSLVNNAGVVELRLLDDTGASLGTIDTGVNDNVWRKVTLAANATDPTTLDVLVDDTVALTGVAATDLRTVWRCYFGGSCYPLVEGKNTACTNMDLAGLVLTPGTSSPSAQYARPTTSVAASTRFADLMGYVSTYYVGGGITGSDDRQVWRTDTTGRTVLDCLQELARTVGGAIFCTTDGTVTLLQPDTQTSTSPAVTIDVEADADAASTPPTWKRAVDSIPTRVTVTSPAGSATVVNAAAEAAGGRRDVSVSSCSATLPDAQSLAAAIINESPALRVAQLAVDLITAEHDLWGALLASSVASTVGTSSSTFNGGSPTTFTYNSGFGLAAGDLLILHLFSASATPPAITSTGWTVLQTFTSASTSLITAWKIADASDVSANSVHISGALAGTARRVQGGYFNQASPFTVTAPYTGHVGSGTADTLSLPPAAGSTLVSDVLFASGTTSVANLNGAPVTVYTSNSTSPPTPWVRSFNGVTIGAQKVFDGNLGTFAWALDGATRGFAQAIHQVQLTPLTTSPYLRPGFRIRVANLPSSTFGASYTDVLVQGWSLDLDEQSFVFTFDTTPADAPVRGQVGTGEYCKAGSGGLMQVTGGTALTTTSAGTLVLATLAGGQPLTTAAGAYPMDLDVNGERVTVSSAPGSSTSPQTVTVTARGVAPTVARAHVAGEAVDIWHAAQVSQ